MPIETSNKSTGCFDIAGVEIFANDILLVKSEQTNTQIVVGVAECRSDGILGLQFKYGNGYLKWDASHHDACYEVVKLN